MGMINRGEKQTLANQSRRWNENSRRVKIDTVSELHIFRKLPRTLVPGGVGRMIDFIDFFMFHLRLDYKSNYSKNVPQFAKSFG